MTFYTDELEKVFKQNIENGDNLANAVYKFIVDMIFSKKIKCGEKIPEEKIVKKLGVSRTPIREALRRLSNEGLVNIYPRRFAEIATFSEEDIRDLGIMRINLDTLAVQLAVENGSNSDFYQLQELSDQCSQAAKEGDIYRRIKLDSDFHLKLTEIGKNPCLLKFQNELYLKVRLFQVYKYKDIDDSLRKIYHHQQIVDKLFERDKDQVVEVAQKHLAYFYNINLEGVRSIIYKNDMYKKI